MAERKKEFLAVYNYGMGVAWMVIRARSAEEITAKFPDLEIVEERPAWMTRVGYASLRRKMSFDADSPADWAKMFLAPR